MSSIHAHRKGLTALLASICLAAGALFAQAPAGSSASRSQPSDEFCKTVQTLVESSRDEFSSVKGDQVKSLLTYWKSTVSLPGAVDSCRLLDGALGKFLTCNMTATVDQKTAEEVYHAHLEKLKACTPSSWSTVPMDDTRKQERTLRFKEVDRGLSPAVEVHLKNRGAGKFQTQIWVVSRAL